MSSMDGKIAPAAQADTADQDTANASRPLKRSLLRGWRCKCPRCGTGPLMRSYLKLHTDCKVCRQDLSHARADDGPAYLTILIVGHLMAPMLHIAFVHFRPDPLILFTIFAVGCVALSLFLLPRFKGMIVGYQWARLMNGFGREAALQDAASKHASTATLDPSRPA
jgi:uncharacterized protein (DUF983 family)